LARLPVNLVMRATSAGHLSRFGWFSFAKAWPEGLALDGRVALPRTVRNEFVFRRETLVAKARR
jgi:hypothetical protein